MHLKGKQLASGTGGIFSSSFSSLFASVDGGALEGRGTSIEYEDWLDTEVEELADAAEEANDVTVPEGVAVLVTNGLQELVDPDGGIDGEALFVQRFYLDRSSTRLNEGPQAGDTNDKTSLARSM